jgi:PEP-CTERM motif
MEGSAVARLIRKLSLCAVLVSGLSQSTQAALVNADFTLVRIDTVAMTGAAAVGEEGDIWNSIDLGTTIEGVIATFATVTTGPLDDAAGDPTALTLTIGGTDVRFWGSTTREPLSLMQDTLAPAWPGGTVTINNVTDGANYDLYLYGASLNDTGAGGRFTVDGVVKESSGATQVDGLLVEGQDYVVYNVTAVGTEIVINYGYEEWQTEGPSFNGLQISESAIAPPLDGDLDNDGFVGITDLNLVLSNWNLNIPPGDPAADPSGDDYVGIEDLNVVLGNWNAGTPPVATVPEPATLSLLGLGGLAILRRR